MDGIGIGFRVGCRVGAVVADGFGIKFATWLMLGVMLGLQMLRDDVGMPAADFRKV